MNPTLHLANQSVAVLGALDVAIIACGVAILGLAGLVAYGFFLAIEQFRGLNTTDTDQRAREAMLLAAERARREREFELAQSIRRG